MAEATSRSGERRDEGRQWLRRCSLLVGPKEGGALELGELRVAFTVKVSEQETPNSASIRDKKICQIDWQKNTLVASIERDGHTITPKGDTEILPGDLLMVLIGRQYYAADYAAYEKLING